MPRFPSLLTQVLIPFVVGLTLAMSGVQATPLSFAVSFTSRVRSTPFTGRILVFSVTDGTVYALDVQQLAPGETVLLDGHALGFPAPPGTGPSRPTRFRAVLDQALDDLKIDTAPGNGISAPVVVHPTDALVPLVIDRLIPTPPFAETSRVKLVDIPSPLLTQFYQRPMRLRAGVVLPEGYQEEPEKRFPVVYYIPGFGGNHFEAFSVVRTGWASLTAKTGPNALVVVLDPTAHTGHHSFADSANNGPFGTALVEEMLPYIDSTFRTVAQPAGRLLTGHSSGGWSSLWLQVTYPERFGGVWSTSPDPVDFHDFYQTDLYAPGANLFTDPQGGRAPFSAAGGNRPLSSSPTRTRESSWAMGARSSPMTLSSVPGAPMVVPGRSMTAAAAPSIPPWRASGASTISARS